MPKSRHSKKGAGHEHQLKHGFVAPTPKVRRRTPCALYRNNGDGTFTDITRSAGLDVDIYGMSACVGDYDNDGRNDLYVTGVGRNYLFHNESRGRNIKFRDVSDELGVRDGGWSISAAWLDYDRDGKLDLIVSHYLDWKPELDHWVDKNGIKLYSAPEHYRPVLTTLYHNEGNHFRDVSEEAGITHATRLWKTEKLWSKGMSVAVGDYNNDMWPDILVTNDLMRNHLFKNNGNGTFTEEGEKAGVVYGNAARPRSGMGAAFADIDHTDRESIAITNFATEMVALYQNQGNGLFQDIAVPAGVAQATAPYVGFGCVFSDIDLDGWPDLFVANGHVYRGVEESSSPVYAQPMQLFRNRSGDKDAGPGGAPVPPSPTGRTERVLFEDISRQSGAVFNKPIVGRGLACADIDLDGYPDFVVCVNNGVPLLLHNDGGNRNHAIRVTLRGTKSNRAAIGAVLWATVGGELLRRAVRSGSSYLSESELPVTFGLGQNAQATLISVRWPSGKLTQFKNVAADQMILIDEDKGIVQRQPLKRG